MKLAVAIIALLGAVGGSISAANAPASAGRSTALAIGQAETIFALPAGNFPEGIALDEQGDIYVGNRRVAGDRVVSEILELSSDGTVTTFAVLAEHEGFDVLGVTGVLGLTTDARGNVYAAVVASDPSARGVWRISPDGSQRSRLPGSEQIGFPNALTFDARGNLYVTDSFRGAVWRFPGGGPGVPWIQHELLAPAPDDPLGIPLVGANGIAFSPPDDLYVANTEKGLVAHVPIDLADGSPGEPSVVAAGFSLLTIDGIAVDARGEIHAVVPGFTVLGTSPLVRVDPATGTTVSTLDPSASGEFDVPLSLAFGKGARDRKSAYVTNGDLPIVPGGTGAGVVQARVGAPGLPIS